MLDDFLLKLDTVFSFKIRHSTTSYYIISQFIPLIHNSITKEVFSSLKASRLLRRLQCSFSNEIAARRVDLMVVRVQQLIKWIALVRVMLQHVDIDLSFFSAQHVYTNVRSGSGGQTPTEDIFGPGRRVPNATLVVLVLLLLVVISSLKIPKAFLIRSGAQRNSAYIFVLTFPLQIYRLRF